MQMNLHEFKQKFEHFAKRLMLVMAFIHTCRLQLRVNKSLCQDEACAVFYHILVIVQVFNIHLHLFRLKCSIVLCEKLFSFCHSRNMEIGL